MSIEDLKEISNTYKFDYKEEELLIIYNFIKDNYLELLNQNIEVFNKIKNKINPSLYKELLNKYIDLKQKYL